MKSTELFQKSFRGSLVLVINLISFALFFARDILATRFFGLNSSMDSVYLGILVPTLLANLIYQPLSDYLVPKFQARIVKELSTLELYLNVVIYAALSAFALAFVFYLFETNVANILAHGFTVKNRELVAGFIQASLPIVIFGSIIIPTTIYLNSHGRYILTASAAGIVPVVAILFMSFYGRSLGVGSFIQGMIIGQVVNLVVLLFFVFKDRRETYDYSKFKLIKVRPKQIFEYSSQNLVNLCFYGFGAIGASFGTNFNEGTTSIVIIVNKLINFFTNLFNVTFSSVLMPYFSRIVLGDKHRFTREKRFFLYVVSYFGIMGVLVVYLFSHLIAKILFFSSKVREDQIEVFIRYIKLGSFQIPLIVAAILCFKWLTIQGKYKSIIVFSSLALIVDLFLNYYLIESVGIVTILIAPAITLVLVLVALKYYMARYDLGLKKKDFLIFFSTWTLLLAVLLWKSFSR